MRSVADRETAFADTIARFVQSQIAPMIDHIETDSNARAQAYEMLGEAGLMGMAAPQSYGGSGLTFAGTARAFEQVAKISVGLAISLIAQNLVVRLIDRNGTKEQKLKWLPGLARGLKLGAFCLSEEGAGSDAASLQTSAVETSGGYVLNGRKVFVTNGGEASVYLVLARTNPRDGLSGISAFLVDKCQQGLRFIQRPVKIGFGSYPIADMELSDCFVPESHRLGPEGNGFKMALEALEGGRINMGAVAVGLAQNALDTAINHSLRRQQFKTRIADFQSIQFMLADMATEVQAARLLVRDAAARFDSGKDIGMHSAMAKRFATDTAMKVVMDAIQILGGTGLAAHPMDKHLWSAKLMQIIEGTNQIQRLIIANRLLKGGSEEAS